jgi:integrase
MSRPRLTKPNYRLRRRGNIWVAEYTDPVSGHTRSVSTRTGDRHDAEVWLDRYLTGQEQPLPPAQPVIDEIVEHYLADRKPRVAAYDTLQWAAAPIMRHVGNLEPRMLGRRTYMDRRAGDGVSDGTVRRDGGMLRAALALAVRDGWIEKAPYIELPPMPEPRQRVLTHDQITSLIHHATAPHVRLFIVQAYHTAARAGAILDARWEQVDFERKLISYDRPGRAKSRKRRATVPLNTAVLAELQAAREVAVTDYVIEFRGNPVASVKTAFKAACRRAGIEDCSPHVLRHSAATHMAEAGVPMAQIARMLGDTEAIVEKVYAKFSPDYLRVAAASLVGGFVSATLSQKRFPTRGFLRHQTAQNGASKAAKR